MVEKTKLKFTILFIFIVVLVGIIIFNSQKINYNQKSMKNESEKEIILIELPEPNLNGEVSLERVINERRSIRNYKDEPLEIKEVSQLLWSVQGITDPESGLRTVPSAGAIYPLSIYLAISNVKNIETAIYQYLPEKHSLKKIKKGDVRNELYENSLHQSSVKNAPLIIIITADYRITEIKYGDRAQRYVDMEVGHAAQNIYLQATALNLGTVVIGAFLDNEIKKIAGLKENESPLYLMPVGKY